MVERKKQKEYIERKRKREINENVKVVGEETGVINLSKEIRDKMRDRISVIWAPD